MTTKLLPARHAAHRPADAGRLTPPDDRRRLERIWRGPADQPRWARPALLGLLALTAVLYLWDLSASGYANSFYAAAVQAGTKSWKAFFFGSLDSGNSITVDKPPASLWLMELSGRIFGFNSWSLLVPQALEGVAAVGLLYSTVRRVASSTAGLAAGAALALTPAAVLMFRFDNPDALLVLCMVTGAYAVTRALEAGRTRWLVLAGSVIGLAFLTKLLQGFLVLPAFALTYLLAGPVPLRRRIGQVLAGTASVLIAVGWTAAFGVATAASPHTGSILSVGPAAAATAASAGGGPGTGGGVPSGRTGGTGSAPGGSAPGGSAKSGSMPTGSAPTGSRTAGGKTSAGVGGGVPSGAGGAATSTALTDALKATSSKWAAAVVGDQSAATLELATGKAVISIGGWSGTDPSPTLAQFEHDVATGQVRYLIASGGVAMGGGSAGVAAQITKWVAAHYKKITIGGQTVYDLSQPLS